MDRGHVKNPFEANWPLQCKLPAAVACNNRTGGGCKIKRLCTAKVTLID